MHRIDFPAGSAIRLTATARPDAGLHRWDVKVLAAGHPADLTPRLSYSSEIGGADCDQRIHIPAQDIACRLEIGSRHATPCGWQDDYGSVEDDTPDGLLIGFSDAPTHASPKDDVQLNFAFEPAVPRH